MVNHKPGIRCAVEPKFPCKKVTNFCPTQLKNAVSDIVRATEIINCNLYVGGDFIQAANTAPIDVNYIAQWDGCSWSALGEGLDGPVNTIVGDSAGNVYVGGLFTQATNPGGLTVAVSNIAMWTGSEWLPLGAGTDGEVFDLTVDCNDLVYVGGNFTTADSVVVNNIAKWDGSTFIALGAGFPGAIVNAVAVDRSLNVYAGLNLGFFDTGYHYIAMWNGTLWKNLDYGVNAPVLSLAIDCKNHLFVGGEFVGAGEVSAKYVAMWDGCSWFPVGFGTDGPVHVVKITCCEDVLVGGDFKWALNSNKKPILVNNVARWDGEEWESLVDGTNGIVLDFATSEKCDIFIGGEFTASSSSAAYIVKFKASCSRCTDFNTLSCPAKARVNGRPYSCDSYTSCAPCKIPIRKCEPCKDRCL
jgi:hypothetical protein